MAYLHLDSVLLLGKIEVKEKDDLFGLKRKWGLFMNNKIDFFDERQECV